MKVLFVGSLWEGSTALHRLKAFKKIRDIMVVAMDAKTHLKRRPFIDRLRHRLRCPADRNRINEELLDIASRTQPDWIIVDNVKNLTQPTLFQIKCHTGSKLAYYSHEDLMAWQHRTRQLDACWAEWDVFFTTKRFNVAELTAIGMRSPILMGNSFNPEVHRPMSRKEVGKEYEAFDAVFIGTCETRRRHSINRLAESGLQIVIYGGGWHPRYIHPSITLRPPVYEKAYAQALHTGKIGLGFLRKASRDLITTRSFEIPATKRAMLAEKTAEHDSAFTDGKEYIGFSCDEELIKRAHWLLQNTKIRNSVAQSGWERCQVSRYDTNDRMGYIIQCLQRYSQGLM